MNLGFGSYNTYYSCEGDLEIEWESQVCFADVFNEVTAYQTNTYHIKLYKEPCQNNFCPFDRKQIYNHTATLRNIYPLRISVTQEEDSYYVNMTISRKPEAFHKYALTWVRYLYEYPFNMVLWDAMRLKQSEPCFKFISIANMFTIAIALNGYADHIHMIPDEMSIPVLISYKEIAKRLEGLGGGRLNELYKYTGEANDYEICDDGRYTFEYWRDQFESRRERYLKFYNEQIKK